MSGKDHTSERVLGLQAATDAIAWDVAAIAAADDIVRQTSRSRRWLRLFSARFPRMFRVRGGRVD